MYHPTVLLPAWQRRYPPTQRQCQLWLGVALPSEYIRRRMRHLTASQSALLCGRNDATGMRRTRRSQPVEEAESAVWTGEQFWNVIEEPTQIFEPDLVCPGCEKRALNVTFVVL